MTVKTNRSWDIFWRCQETSSRWRTEEDCSMLEVPRRRKLGLRS